MLTLLNRLLRRGERRLVERLPAITIAASPNYYKAFTAPNPVLSATIYSTEGCKVGTAIYALSPLADRVYVFDLEIGPHHQRQGFGTAVLWHLAKEYGQPITAIKELHSAAKFWDAARRLGAAGLVVTEQISVSEMKLEAERWQHLRSSAENLDRQIGQRLHVYHEPWATAVGRGLDAETFAGDIDPVST